ncbi:MAG: hypothetical protein EBY81_02800 [Verrucomicrobia bacterium]|nr:hypothetical protein [Verrucomicrobiota bacterium]
MGVTEHALPWDSGAPAVTDELTRWIWAESGTERVTRDRVDGQTITYPGRNNALASLAGSMRRRGMTQPEIEAALLATNASRVDPPLDDDDVRRIAKSVSRYEVADEVLKMVERGQSDPVYGGDAGTNDTLTPVSIRAIAEMENPGYVELLGPLVMRGLRTLVGAATGEGKTTLVMWMMRAIIEGTGFIDWAGIGPDEDGKKPTVLIIDAEQTIPDIQRLAKEIGMEDSEQIQYLAVPDGLNLGESTNDALQVERIIEQMRPDVLVVDPLYKVAAIDSNNEQEAVSLMKLFDRWRTEYDFAFVMPVHTRKSDKKNPGNAPTLDDIFGSGAFSRGAEVILGLRQSDPGFSRMFVWKHRPGMLQKGTHIDMSFDRDTGFARVYHEGMQTNAQLVEEVLAKNPIGLTVRSIGEKLGKSDVNIRKTLSALDENIDGFNMPNSKRKLYRLAEDEENVLTSWEDLVD